MLTSQRLTAADNMLLHCFSLLPAKSAGWIPIKQAHSIQVNMTTLLRITAVQIQILPWQRHEGV
jgi:hypothetical protein